MSISSKLNLKKNTWLSCKYTIHVSIKFADGTVRKLENAQINGLYMEKDYDNDHLPIMMIDLALGELDVNKVDDQTIFHVKMNQYYLENNDDESEKKSKKVYLDDEFIRIGYGTKPDAREKFKKKIRNSMGVNDGDLTNYDLTKPITFILFKKSDLIMSKAITNDVFVNANMEDIVCRLLTDVGCPRKVLMSNFINTKEYSELLLEPKNFIEQLVFLENEFGWHPEGTYIFLDYDRFYITRKCSTPTVWVGKEPQQVCFTIPFVDQSDDSSNGIIEKNNIIYVNVGTDKYTMVDSSIVEDQISGTGLILTNTLTGKTTIIDGDNSTLTPTGSYANKMYHGHNPYVIKQYKLRKKENDHIWDIECINTDLSYYTPQRQFTFLSDVTKISSTLKGKYRISSMKVSFAKAGTAFNNIAKVRVKRTSTLN